MGSLLFVMLLAIFAGACMRLQPTRALWEASQDLLAADTGTLAAVTAMKLHLAAADFNPTLDIALGTLVEATFTGSAAKSAGTGTQPTFYDVGGGYRVIEILEPAGGWHWTCTATPAAPETIYGVFLTDNASAVLYGTEKFDNPITITASGQGIDLPFAKLRFRTNSPF